MPVARPVASSAVTTTAFSRGFSVRGLEALRQAGQEPLEDRDARSTPMTESCGPVMPTSVMYAVPCGSTRASAVGTCVCVPTTAVDAAVEVPAHRDLLGGGLGVEVDEDDARLVLRTASISGRTTGERVVDGGHEDPSHDVDDRHRHAVRRRARPRDRARACRRGSWPVGAAADARDVGTDLLLVPAVIAAGDDVRRRTREVVGEVRRDAEARRGVLAVGDDEVDLVMGDERRAGRGAPVRGRACRRCRR